MNKATTLLLVILLVCLNSFSQTLTPTNTPGVTGRSTFPVEDRYLFARQHLGLPRYNDTTQANVYNGLQDTCGAVIYTYDVKALWFRSCSPKKWVQILPSGSPTTANAWILRGNDLTGISGDGELGTSSYDDFFISTNNQKRFRFSKDGIGDSTSTVVPVGIDTATGTFAYARAGGGGGGGSDSAYVDATAVNDSTLRLYRLNGDSTDVALRGTAAASWTLTGNSGTIAGTNFIGTIDDVDFVIKRFDEQHGRFGNTTVVLGKYAGLSGLPDNSVGIGSATLANNVSGDGLTAVGANALNSNTTGAYSTATGSNALIFNTIGNFNTADGDDNLSNNISGNNNTSLGFAGGKYNTNESGRLYITAYDHGSHINDSLNSIIHGLMNQATPSAQKLFLNARVTMPYLPTGLALKRVMIDVDGNLYAADTTASGGSGEVNTASNLGGGLANYDSKSGVDLRFNSFAAADFDLASNVINIDAGLKTDWNTAYTDRLKWDGGATGLTASTGRTSLGGTTIGQNIFTSTNPSAITFLRGNADNSVDWLSASAFRTAIGAGDGTTPLSSITAAAGTNTINNANNAQVWQWNSLTSGGMSLSSNSTAMTNSSSLFSADVSGALATSGITTYAAKLSNTHTGTTVTNIAGRLESSGSTHQNIAGSFSATGTSATNTAGSFYADGASSNTAGSFIVSGGAASSNRAGYFYAFTSGGTSTTNTGGEFTATGTSTTNIGGRFAASAGTNNYAIIVPASSGSVGIGTSAPATILHTVGTVRHETLGTASSDTTTNKPVGINSSGDIIPMTYWPGAGGGGYTADQIDSIARIAISDSMKSLHFRNSIGAARLFFKLNDSTVVFHSIEADSNITITPRIDANSDTVWMIKAKKSVDSVWMVNDSIMTVRTTAGNTYNLNVYGKANTGGSGGSGLVPDSSRELASHNLFSSSRLTSYYKLESTADSKGSNTLTNNGTTPFNAAKFNNGADLGSSNSTKYMSVATDLGISGNANLSLSCWVKITTQPGTGVTYHLISHASNNGLDRYLSIKYVDAGGVKSINIDAGGNDVIVFTTTLSTSVFTHLAVVRNVVSGKIYLYINGKSVSNENAGGLGSGGFNGFGIGASFEATNIASAIIDDASVWAGVLTPEEIELIYTTNRSITIGGNEYTTVNRNAVIGLPLNNFSVSNQTIAAATTELISGSSIAVPADKLKIGTYYKVRLSVSKTAAGTAACTYLVKLGTAGTTADATIITFTLPVGTAVVDAGFIDINVLIRGPLTSACIANGHLTMTHNLSATGLATVPVVNLNVTSSGFDATAGNLILSVACTTAASTVYTFQQVFAETVNL